MTIGAKIQDMKERAAHWGVLAVAACSPRSIPGFAYTRARTAAHYGRKALALKATIKRPCECEDPGCPVHNDASCDGAARTTLYRSDMEDRTGVRFCAACAEDAMSAGVFSSERNFYSR